MSAETASSGHVESIKLKFKIVDLVRRGLSLGSHPENTEKLQSLVTQNPDVVRTPDVERAIRQRLAEMVRHGDLSKELQFLTEARVLSELNPEAAKSAHVTTTIGLRRKDIGRLPNPGEFAEEIKFYDTLANRQ